MYSRVRGRTGGQQLSVVIVCYPWWVVGWSPVGVAVSKLGSRKRITKLSSRNNPSATASVHRSLVHSTPVSGP